MVPLAPCCAAASVGAGALPAGAADIHWQTALRGCERAALQLAGEAQGRASLPAVAAAGRIARFRA